VLINQTHPKRCVSVSQLAKQLVWSGWDRMSWDGMLWDGMRWVGTGPFEMNLSLSKCYGAPFSGKPTPKPPSEQTAGSLQIVLKVDRANIVFRSSPSLTHLTFPRDRPHPDSSGKQIGAAAISLARILLQS